MKKETKKPRLEVGKCLDRGKPIVCTLVRQDPTLLHRWLADATDEELWRMVTIFRDTNLWTKFLRAFLSLSQDVWMHHKLVVEKAFQHFEGKEVEEIISIYEGMGTDVKARRILDNLNYDKYWTRRVQKAGEDSSRAAQKELNKARNGLDLGGIPTKPSKKCLAELAAYVNSLKEKKTRK